MGSLRDGGAFGAVGSVVAVLADFAVNSGEFVAAVVSWLVTNTDLLLPMFTTLRSQVAPRVAWLPEGLLDKVVLALAFLMVLVLASRLVTRTVN